MWRPCTCNQRWKLTYCYDSFSHNYFLNLFTSITNLTKHLFFLGFPSTVANSCDMGLSLSCLENQLSRLHVTAFFNRKGQAQETSDYVSSSAVHAALGSMTTLTIIAWTITPRVVTARVKLTPQQLKLWANLDSSDFKEGRDNFNGTHLSVSHYDYLQL